MRYVYLVLLIIGIPVVFLACTLELYAQRNILATAPTHIWRQPDYARWRPDNARQQPLQNLSANAHLARPRWQRARNARLPATSRWKRPQTTRGTIYSAPYFAITTPWAIPNLSSNPYPPVHSPSTRKPFAGVRPAPTAVDRYWPLLYEAREDPKTGLIIWSLP